MKKYRPGRYKVEPMLQVRDHLGLYERWYWEFLIEKNEWWHVHHLEDCIMDELHEIRFGNKALRKCVRITLHRWNEKKQEWFFYRTEACLVITRAIANANRLYKLQLC